MGKIIIMTDSASDISENEEKELGIKVECPDYPLLLTPLAIACLPLMEG